MKVLVALIVCFFGISNAHAWTCSGSAPANSTCVNGTWVQNPITQQQQQKQGQIQGQSQQSISSASGNGSGNSFSTGASTASGTGGDAAINSTVESNYRAAKIPVNTAYSAALTSGIDTCLGSTSAGGQTSVLGLTFGTTRRDKNCEHIKNAHLIAEFNQTAGCIYMLKNVQGAQEAFDTAGVTCIPPPITPEVIVKEVEVPVERIIYVEVPAKVIIPVHHKKKVSSCVTKTETICK